MDGPLSKRKVQPWAPPPACTRIEHWYVGRGSPKGCSTTNTLLIPAEFHTKMNNTKAWDQPVPLTSAKVSFQMLVVFYEDVTGRLAGYPNHGFAQRNPPYFRLQGKGQKTSA